MRWHIHSHAICLALAFVLADCEAQAQAPAKITKGPPELQIAVILRGRTLELSQFSLSIAMAPEPADGLKAAAQRADEFTLVEAKDELAQTNSFELAKLRLVARRVDGTPVPQQVLVTELAKPTPVIVIEPGERIDPRFVPLFKAETLVLQLPSVPSRTYVPDASRPVLVPSDSKPSTQNLPARRKSELKPATSKPRQR